MFSSKNLFFDSNAGGYQISRSVRLRSSASAYFNRTMSAGTSTQKGTQSFWVKRGLLATLYNIGMCAEAASYPANGAYNIIQFSSGDNLLVQCWNGSSYDINLTTSAVYRDPSAWYHIIVAWDTTQSTASNRCIVYVNGVQVTSYSTSTYPTQNTNLTGWGASNNYTIGADKNNSNVLVRFLDGYLAEFNYVDGQALTPSSFGATSTTTGVWGPAKYTGTYGTNGFYLNFSDNSGTTATTIGKDSSGNGNNWTPNNISVTTGVTYDSMVDTPTQYGIDTGAGGEVRGNYCVMNPVAKNSRITIANANLQVTGDNTSNHQIIYGTFPITTGKWYWEVVVNNPTTSTVNIVGIQSYVGFADGTIVSSSGNGIGWGYTTNAGNFYSSNFTVSGSAPVLANGTIGIAYDADAGKIWFRNTSGSWVQGDPAAGTSPTGTLSGTATTVMPAVSFYNSNGAWSFNFGQRTFTYIAPSGYQALCTQNLPVPTINNGANYMAATLYTGTGASQNITNTVGSASFKPDFVWMKIRSTTGDHQLVDSVRGNTAYLFSDLTNAEVTASDRLTSFNSNGFTLGTSTAVNTNAATYVGWQWNAGSGSSSSNTSGSITSTVSVNQTAGFSVVTYTGSGASATVGHGLGVAPSMIIIKNRGSAQSWRVYHTSVGVNAYLLLDSSAGSASDSGWTATSSTTFTVGGSGAQYNASTNTYVAYCFAPIAGYSAFGSYTGNGAADGPFVYCGFRPRWILTKRYDGGANYWSIEDTSRNTYNTANAVLYPNTSDAESTSNFNVDINSNGFKFRSTSSDVNLSGGTYIYAAFAETAFKFANAR